MKPQRKIEVFSAGCPVCKAAISLLSRLACPSCEVIVLDMNKPAVAKNARRLDIRSVPAVVIEGQRAGCCSQGIDAETLQAEGLGEARPE